MRGIEAIGINKGKVAQFNNKGIYTIEDLVKFKPRKYMDFRKPVPFSRLTDGQVCSVVGIVEEVKTGKNVVTIKLKEDNLSSKRIYITYFNQPFMAKAVKQGFRYIFCGTIKINKEYYNRISMDNPLEYSTNLEKLMRIRPVYSKIAGMSDDYLLRSIDSALALVPKEDYLEYQLVSKYDLMSYGDALRALHQPRSNESIEESLERLLFDDLFKYNMHLQKNRGRVNAKSDFVMKKFDMAKTFMDSLPFELTDGQREALRVMSRKMVSGQRVNALVQADVGAGKTMVAVLMMIVACNNGHQGVLMAPTNVLAKQHYEEIKERVAPLGLKVGFLSGELKASQRKKTIEEIKAGTIDIIVGTHAVISRDVEFKSLGVAIVDEEHRFGVTQRNSLKDKADKGVHTITMSATPIPRSLALTIYGDDVDVITIKTLPKGRQPVDTKLITKEAEAYEKMYQEIKAGRQCYVVCPLITDSESMEGVDSVETTLEKMKKYFRGRNVRISAISGRMKQEEVAEEIRRFSDREYDIIVSTTIIEVGVNVPNSTVILIKNAERFGLAQLHQLRGRVGRGSHKSYCLLLSENPTIQAKEKLQVMVDTTDGFTIAKKDLQIRGMGDFIGTSQSGNNKYVMLMIANEDLNLRIKEDVREIFDNPSRLLKYRDILSEELNG